MHSGAEINVLATRVSLTGDLQRRVPWALEALDERRADAAASGDRGASGDSAARPLRQRPWQPESQPLSFVLVVEASTAYGKATDLLRAALSRFLSALPRGSQGQLVRFAARTDGLSGFLPAAALVPEAARYNATVDGELRLVQAVQQAQEALRQRPVGTRRALVVVADGRNPVMNPHLFYLLGESLGRDEIPLYAIGFSARDMRGPLRNLADLSKRSGGTFRWARAMEDLGPQLMSLVDELKGAEAITFSLPGAARRGGPLRLRLRCGEGLSNVSVALQGAEDSRRWWLFLVGGALLAGVAYLARRSRRRRRAQPQTSAPSLPAVPLTAPGPALVASDGRCVALGATLELTASFPAAGPAVSADQVLGVIRRVAPGYKLEARAGGIYLNGHLLIGSMPLRAGDQIRIDGCGEWVLRTDWPVSPA